MIGFVLFLFVTHDLLKKIDAKIISSGNGKATGTSKMFKILVLVVLLLVTISVTVILIFQIATKANS
jgi:hypothetical protein